VTVSALALDAGGDDDHDGHDDPTSTYTGTTDIDRTRPELHTHPEPSSREHDAGWPPRQTAR
jgi:hypothetical protein